MKFVLAGLGVFFVVLMGVILLTGGNGTPDTTNIIEQEQRFDAITPDTTVSYVLQGSLRGEEERRSIKITVDRNNRVVEEIAGYGDAVVKSKQYSNTDAAFAAFAQGLEKAGFITTHKSILASEDGACPFGSTHVFRALQEAKEVHRSWATSCRKVPGTFAGKTTTVQKLFQAQIVDYREFAKSIKL